MLRTVRHTSTATWFRHRRLWSLLVPALLTACGRTLPTAPVTRHAAAATSIAALSAADAIDGEIVVTLADGVDPGELAASNGAVLVRDASAEHVVALAPGPGLTALDLRQQLAADPRVLAAEPNAWLETAESRQQSFAFDDGAGSPEAAAAQPALEAIDVDAAHAAASGAGVTVAILDTGIDPDHPLLQRAFAGGVDLVDGDDDPTEVRNFVDDDGDGQVDEAFGHGTHVAGIVHMVAPGARILAVRVLGDDGRGSLADVVAGVRWATAHGAKVINLSLGTLARSESLQAALGDAEQAGVVVIVSAGNWGDDKPVEFPASSSHVAAIGAVDASAQPAGFSSYGDIVALAAPGVAVRSSYPGGGYRLWSGTSMSAPFVAGTCALLAEAHPLWTRAQMLERIAETAAHVHNEDGADMGAGALDAGAALAPDLRARDGDAPLPERLRRR